MIDKALLTTFEPFQHMAGIQPGFHRLDEVIELLDEPEGVELKTNNDNLSGHIVLQYPSRGICFLVEFGPECSENPVIDGVWLEEPFAGVSEKGLRLDMDADECRKLCQKHYYMTSEYEDFGFVAPSKAKSDDNDLQLWFDLDKLTRIKLFRGT